MGKREKGIKSAFGAPVKGEGRGNPEKAPNRPQGETSIKNRGEGRGEGKKPENGLVEGFWKGVKMTCGQAWLKFRVDWKN